MALKGEQGKIEKKMVMTLLRYHSVIVWMTD
jgi:hypothetical protein